MRNGKGLVPDRRAPASFLTEWDFCTFALQIHACFILFRWQSQHHSCAAVRTGIGRPKDPKIRPLQSKQVSWCLRYLGLPPSLVLAHVLSSAVYLMLAWLGRQLGIRRKTRNWDQWPGFRWIFSGHSVTLNRGWCWPSNLDGGWP